MARRAALRFMTTIQDNTVSLQWCNKLEISKQKTARKVENAIQAARMATKIAAEEGSDQTDRTEALLKVKYAISQYRKLAALGSPAIILDESGSAPVDDNQDSIASFENDVTKLYGEDIQAMKKEIFESNRQRVWIGWRGWF
ncbi:unnamed protein product [Agarophyton chilense]